MCPGPWASPHVWGCSRLGAVVWHPGVRGPEVGPEISTWTWRCEAPRALWVPSKSWRCRSQLSHRCGAARVISLSAPASLECSPLLFEPWLLVQLELWSPGTAVLASGQTWRWHVCDTGWAAFFLGQQQSGVGITRAGWTWGFWPGPGEPCFSGLHQSSLLPLQLCWGGGLSAGALICREAWFPSWFCPCLLKAGGSGPWAQIFTSVVWEVRRGLLPCEMLL